MDGDGYLPDPRPGLGWTDFVAARGRYLARLAAGSEIARLERAFALSLDDDDAPGGGPAETGGRATHPPGAHAR